MQAPTQFQGSGSSHELASLLLTEAIQHCLFKAKHSIFVLLLDAKSAFDIVIRQNAIVEAFKAGTTDQGLIYINNRMEQRRTFPQWETSLMGPINDQRGLEQGAVLSDRLYKLYNNSQLQEAQDSGLGIDLENILIAAIGQADDCALITDSPLKMCCLLHLTKTYCERQHVELVPEKTKLLVWSPSKDKQKVELLKLQCPIHIDSHQISYTESAVHVGVHRSTSGGNMLHILERIAAHKRSIGAILHTGIARHHRANISSCLQLEQIYGNGVLFSGVASLVLNNKELSAISRHYKSTLNNFMKLPPSTPDCVVFFLSGRLPASAMIDLCMLGLLGMIARLGSTNILNQVGRKVLLSKPCNKQSWFTRIRLICSQYLLPDPIAILDCPPVKDTWKSLCKAKVISHWEEKLRGEAFLLPSLKFFLPQFMSLKTPHKMLLMPENSYENEKVITVIKMLSGRYVSDYHSRHWSKLNPEGICQLCRAKRASNGTNVSIPVPLGTLDHLLLYCEELSEQRSKCRSLWESYTSDKPIIRSLTINYDLDNITWYPNMQLLLDPTVCPEIISASQKHRDGIFSHVCYLTRTWCHSIHIRRIKLLKLYNII